MSEVKIDIKEEKESCKDKLAFYCGFCVTLITLPIWLPLVFILGILIIIVYILTCGLFYRIDFFKASIYKGPLCGGEC